MSDWLKLTITICKIVEIVCKSQPDRQYILSQPDRQYILWKLLHIWTFFVLYISTSATDFIMNCDDEYPQSSSTCRCTEAGT